MRGVGRTQNLIDTLPDCRCAIVTSNNQIGRSIKDRIESDRGKEYAKHVKFFAISNHDDLTKMMGYSNPIFFDHSFFEMVDEVIVKKTLESAHNASVVYQHGKTK